MGEKATSGLQIKWVIIYNKMFLNSFFIDLSHGDVICGVKTAQVYGSLVEHK